MEHSLLRKHSEEEFKWTSIIGVVKMCCYSTEDDEASETFTKYNRTSNYELYHKGSNIIKAFRSKKRRLTRLSSN